MSYLQEISGYISQSFKSFKQYQATRDIAHLDNVILIQRRVIALMHEAAPPGEAIIPKMLSDLGMFLQYRYKRLGELNDLENSISAHQQAVQLTADGDLDMPKRLLGLVQALDARFTRSGNLEDLESVLSMQCCAVELTPEGHVDLPERLHQLAIAFGQRFKRHGEIDDIDSAILTQRRAVGLTPQEDVEMPGLLYNLGVFFRMRFQRHGKLDDLDSIISTQRRALALAPEGHSDMLELLENLGTAFLFRFDRQGELSDLDSLISSRRRSVELAPEGHPHMAEWLRELGFAFEKRFWRNGDLDDLHNAILMQFRAVELRSEDHPQMPVWLHNIGGLLKTRFESHGNVDDLERAISTLRRAVALAPEGHPQMPNMLGDLANSFKTRFERLGELDDLENDISTQRRAVKLTPDGHPVMPMCLNNLGLSFLNRYKRFRELEDIDRGISTLRRAVELFPKGHTGLPGALTNLALCLRNRFEHLEELDDINSAIETQHRAVELAPEGDPFMWKWLMNLGNVLTTRFDYSGDLDDLASLILAQHRAIELLPEGHANKPGLLNNLGASLRRRFERCGERNDLDSAILMQRRAVELTPEGHYYLTRFLPELAYSLEATFRLENSKESFDAVISAFENASAQMTGLPFHRLDWASRWAKLEIENSEFGSAASQLRACSCIIDTLPEVAWLGNSISRRYKESAMLARWSGDAVSAAIALGDLRLAITWLDAGRSLIWSQVLSLRTPVDELAQSHSDLAEEFQKLSSELQSSHLMQLPKDASPINTLFSDETNQHRPTVINYESCLKRIRACPGFEHFLRPQKLTSLTPLTEHLDGHVVFINVSFRCDALVISRGGSVKLVPLPELSKKRANTLRLVFTNHLHFSNIRQRAVVQHSEAKAKGFSRVLDRIWKWIVSPVLKALELMQPNRERLPHITWCLTGSLAQLPFHAAGLNPELGPSGPHVYDFVVSSYTPSLSALMRAQGGPERKPSALSALIVTQHATPGLSPLPGTITEGVCLKALLSGSQINSEVFDDNQATVETIQLAMGHFPWVHFACHGVQDASDPTQSAFALYDGKLTLSTLMKTVSEGAELAFLSACQTATGDMRAPEESAHLTAGMLAVGFKGVVGTMWSIGDADAPVVVEAYYKKLLELRSSGAVAQGSTGAAYALHDAVKVLRERVGEKSFMSWVPFVHYGA